MIKFSTGNILDDQSDALVNTVNCVGTMGKGLALEFKKKFPINFRIYKRICDENLLKPGKLLIVPLSDITIVNFPTKLHWKNPSKIEYVRDGLLELKEQIINPKGLLNHIKSIAIPKLGCGLGKLNWTEVRELILHTLDLQIDITIYE